MNQPNSPSDNQSPDPTAPNLASQVRFYDSRIPSVTDLGEVLEKHKVRLENLGFSHTRAILSIREDQYITLSIGTAPAGTVSVAERLGVRTNPMKVARKLREALILKAANLSLDVLTGRVSRAHLQKHCLKRGRFPVVCSRSLPSLDEVEAKLVALRKDKQRLLAAYFEEQGSNFTGPVPDWRNLSVKAKMVRDVDGMRREVQDLTKQRNLMRQRAELRKALRAPVKVSMILVKAMTEVWDLFTQQEMDQKLKVADLRKTCLIANHEIEYGQSSRQAASNLRSVMCNLVLSEMDVMRDDEAETLWRAGTVGKEVLFTLLKMPPNAFFRGEGEFTQISALSADDKQSPRKVSVIAAAAPEEEPIWEITDPATRDNWDDIPGINDPDLTEQEVKARRLAEPKEDAAEERKRRDKILDRAKEVARQAVRQRITNRR